MHAVSEWFIVTAECRSISVSCYLARQANGIPACGLYILPLFFYLFLFLTVPLGAKIISESTGLIFTKCSGIRNGRNVTV